MAARLYLVRHGEVCGNAEGRFIGRSDPALSAAGAEQVSQTAAILRSRLPATGRIICSPLQRARASAAIVAAALDGWPVQIDPALREIDFGRWEMLNFADVQDRDAELVRRWCATPAEFVFPGGDAVAAFVAGAAVTAQRLAAAAAAEPGAIVVVSHGGVIRALTCALLQLDYHQHGLAFAVPPAALVQLLLTAPDTAVLEALLGPPVLPVDYSKRSS